MSIMTGYYYDTHVHTSESSPCGKVKGQQVARLYKAAGYHGIVITDHYTRNFFRGKGDWGQKIDRFLAGYRAACREGKKIGLHVFLGLELALTGRHEEFLLFGVREDFLRNYPELYKLELKSLLRLARKENILIYQAHPFRFGSPVNPSLLDGIEVFNGNPRHESYNEQAYKYAKKHRLKMISGSDFHQKMDLGRGGIITPRKITSQEALLRVLNESAFKLIRISERPFSAARVFTRVCGKLLR